MENLRFLTLSARPLLINFAYSFAVSIDEFKIALQVLPKVILI